jgi:hypothetical protein
LKQEIRLSCAVLTLNPPRKLGTTGITNEFGEKRHNFCRNTQEYNRDDLDLTAEILESILNGKVFSSGMKQVT